MKMIIIGIFDRKAQSFIEMSATPSVGVAARIFSEAVNKPSESPVYKWPEDHELYELGTWDSESGIPLFLAEEERGQYQKRLIVTGESLKVRN